MLRARHALRYVLNRTVPARRSEPWYREAERVERAQMAVVRRHGLVVQAGPFAGMALLAQAVTGTVPPKLVGSYEEEIAPAVERMIERKPRTVVNIGPGEGYYAVGLARRLPDASVYAFDIDQRAQDACREMAERNGVGSRVKIGGECTKADLQSLLADGGLVVIDCEGCERELVDASLPRADWIIESHDFVAAGTTELLCERLEATHDIERVEQRPRDPSKYPELAVVPPALRDSAVAERRQPELCWLACFAR